MTLSITLPLPHRDLSPNGRPHHMAKARHVKTLRTRAKLAALSQLPGGYKPRFKRAKTQVFWFKKRDVEIDGDNALASCKAAFDGITDSGFLDDDRGLTHRPVIFDLDRENPRLEIVIISE